MDNNSTTTQQGAQATAQSSEYNIPDVVMKKYPDLVELIKKTESMSKDERNYWFQILPIMTDDQVTRLRKILDDEASQLTKLDDQYQKELSKLNQKHLNEWNEFERNQAREDLKKKEEEAQKHEGQTEEELLKKLSDV